MYEKKHFHKMNENGRCECSVSIDRTVIDCVYYALMY